MDTRQRFAQIPWWLAAIVVTRELILLGGMVAIHYAAGKFMARPRLLGKLATVLQMTAVLWTLLKFPVAPLSFITIGAGLFTVVSVLFYLYDFTRQWKGDVAGMKMESGPEAEIPRS